MISRVVLGTALALLAFGRLYAQEAAESSKEKSREQSLVELTNQARAEAGVPPLTWDAGLAAAAHAHAVRMAAERTIAHRYGGEPDLPERAAAAGAHFSLIEENVAAADTAFHVHQSWMKSQGHHDNLLNPAIDRIGVALVQSHGTLYAVADYARAVAAMTPDQVEAEVGKVLAAKGVTLMPYSGGARAYCAQQSASDSGTSAANEMKPRFLMRWQRADITNLPPQLTQALASGQFKQGSVGACAPQGTASGSGTVFSGFRVAVLLY